jgi:DNA (cytosine-5)-methyltransferase 1
LKKPDKVRKELNRILVGHKLTGFSAVDVFCGAGAVTHGLIKAGMPVNAGIDNDESCKYAYEKNNKARFINKDVRRLSGTFVRGLYPDKDIKILVGCAPCQPFSKFTQKNKKRKEDEKWRLLYAFSGLIEKVKPHVISMENVNEITNQKVFTDFIETLESLKYHVSWKSVYCPDYGIPQSRRRLVLLASKLGKIELMPKTHEPLQYKTVRQTIGKLEPIENGETSRKDTLHRASKLSPLNKKRIEHSKPGGTWLDWDEELRAPCHRKKTGCSYTGVYSRMEWDKPSPTITTQFYSYGTGRFGHPEQDRALSLREGALLQTFPKYYDFIDPKEKFSMNRTGIHIGNAVPVKLGLVIGKSIMNHLKDNSINVEI